MITSSTSDHPVENIVTVQMHLRYFISTGAKNAMHTLRVQRVLDKAEE